MIDPWDTLKLLADPTRMRLLSLIADEELTVSELQEVLDMGQSRISSHLALLRQGELVVDRREGKKTFYSINPSLPPDTRSLLDATRKSLQDHPTTIEDRQNLNRIIDKRRRQTEEYFNLVAGRLTRNYCPGRSWQAIGHALLHLTPHIRIVDLGAGEGMIAQLLARQAEMVYCIDNSPRMVEVGTELAQRNQIENLIYKLGDIEKVPLPAKSVDLDILSQALHHARHPQTAVNEAYRILKPGGKILILDLREHQFEKAHELYADLWLGFKENTLYQFLQSAGFASIEVSVVAREEHPPHFETLLAAGIRKS